MANESDNSVVIPKSHRNEWKSKRNFEEAIESLGLYMPFGWAIRDYGIDGQVEITRPLSGDDTYTPESKFFLVQLKSAERTKVTKKNIHYSLPVKKIIQWYSANLPVMFALNDLAGGEIYTLWIDDNLISWLDGTNENWVNQKEITVRIPIANRFSDYTLNNLREYVLNWKAPIRKIILPGLFFDLKERCHGNLSRLSEFNSPFRFDSIANSSSILLNQLEGSIYRIAVTGLSRVGKSTLINALLKRDDISPVGFFQTTGVPIQILPGKVDEVKIVFKDGKSTQHPFSTDLIEQYASQNLNEDNNKGVSLVVVYLANRQLEHGISFYDIPGLDDPDDSVFDYTWSTVSKSNAILYVLDASPAENGGFIFKSDYKRHILELGQKLDKIFLVFNKVNALSPDNLKLLQDRVVRDLKKLNLYDKVADKIYYISAKESLEVRASKGNGIDTVKQLEDDIWRYLLHENKIGVANLLVVGNGILRAAKDFEDILKVRLLDNSKREELQSAISAVKKRIPDLNTSYHAEEAKIRAGLQQSIENKKNQIILNLETYLKSFKINQNLPDKKFIKNYLSQNVHVTLESLNQEYAHQLNLLKEMIDNWIEQNLKTVREIIGGNVGKKNIDISEVENFEPPEIDLSSSFGVGLLLGIVGFFINPPMALAAGISGFFGNLFLSAGDRRAKRIVRIVDESRRRYNNLFPEVNKAYSELLYEHSTAIIGYANKKLTAFFEDIDVQIAKLNSPISAKDKVEYEKAFDKLQKLREDVISFKKEIDSYFTIA